MQGRELEKDERRKTGKLRKGKRCLDLCRTERVFVSYSRATTIGVAGIGCFYNLNFLR